VVVGCAGVARQDEGSVFVTARRILNAGTGTGKKGDAKNAKKGEKVTQQC